MAMNALLGGKNSGHGGSGGGGHSSSPLGNLGGLANQFLGGSHGGSGSGGENKPSGAGKLVGQLAQSFMHSASQEKPPAPQNYHGSSNQNSHQQQQGGGIAGQIMGGVATMFGGKHGSSVGLRRWSWVSCARLMMR
jgi:hypothetical protein